MRTSKHIQNLKCEGCGNTIAKELEKISGITDVTVDPETKLVTFNSGSEEDIENVKVRLLQLGYPFTEDKNNLIIKAKSFVSCAVGKLAEKKKA